MFGGLHGSAPAIAGQGIANPSGLLLAGVMMMVHLGQPDVAETVHNAWLKTIEDGVHTFDVFKEGISKEQVGTRAFADAVIARLGQKPVTLPAVSYSGEAKGFTIPTPVRRTPAVKDLVGIDVFAHHGGETDALAEQLQGAAGDLFELAMITNRGVKVWPGGLPETFCTDHWRCRFMAKNGAALTLADTVSLMGRLVEAGVPFIKTEQLFTFDGEPGYSLGQGQ
jgi:isocitrate dehydrogenase